MWLAVNGTNFISDLGRHHSNNPPQAGHQMIFKVFRREVQFSTTSAEKFLGFTGGRRLRSLIFSIIESGMALFSIQLVRVICSLHQFLPINGVLCFIIVTHQLLNGIIPTIILLRLLMGLSFDGPSPISNSQMGSTISREEWIVNDIDGSEDIHAVRSNAIQSNEITEIARSVR